MRTLQSSAKLPPSGPAREALREKGQFWTPEWVAEAMVAYVTGGSATRIFDPAVGAGAFFLAACRRSQRANRSLVLEGTELHPDVLEQAVANGLSRSDLARVESRDFVLDPPRRQFPAIVANPPYIRHHRLGETVKRGLRLLAREILGRPLDGRAGIHIYFLLRALSLLEKDGRLSFIIPSDTVEGVFSKTLWRWITAKFRLEAVITFDSDASPFPAVDTNPVIVMIKNAEPDDSFWWARCQRAETADLNEWVASGFREQRPQDLLVTRREISEALETGFSRKRTEHNTIGYTLKDFAFVLRGIATGANDFFFLTRQQAETLGVPDSYLVPAIGRTRDVVGELLDSEALRELEKRGRPTLLLSIGAEPFDNLPPALKEYIARGEGKGLHTRPLIATRRPWYKMEARRVPPILFAYLGRRNARFVRNLAGVVPLTGFLCIYARNNDAAFVDKLWRALRDPKTIANLPMVGKSYGGGAIKVEPRALDRLMIPREVAEQAGLAPASIAEQLALPQFA